MTTKILEGLSSVIDGTLEEVNKKWKEIAFSIGWDGIDGRVRLDSLK